MHMLKKAQMILTNGQKLSAAEQLYSLAARLRLEIVQSCLSEIT